MEIILQLFLEKQRVSKRDIQQSIQDNIINIFLNKIGNMSSINYQKKGYST